MITQVDHVVVPWPELDEAIGLYGDLGFMPTPGGSHLGLGTANFMIEFPNTFVELVGVVDRSQAAASGSLERFDHASGTPVSYLIRSTDVLEDLGLLGAAGLTTSGPREYTRKGEDDALSVLRVGTLLGLNDDVVLTLVEPVGSAGRRRCVSHPNGAVELVGMSFASDSWDLLVEAYRALGAAMGEQEDGWTVAIGPATIRIGRECGPGIDIAVVSLPQTVDYLRRAGVPFCPVTSSESGQRCTLAPWRDHDLSYLSFVEASC